MLPLFSQAGRVDCCVVCAAESSDFPVPWGESSLSHLHVHLQPALCHLSYLSHTFVVSTCLCFLHVCGCCLVLCSSILRAECMTTVNLSIPVQPDKYLTLSPVQRAVMCTECSCVIRRLNAISGTMCIRQYVLLCRLGIVPLCLQDITAFCVCIMLTHC